MPSHALSDLDLSAWPPSVPPRTDIVAVEMHPRERARFPAVGDEFLGFGLLAVLGTGGFGKVFLAREAALGDRAVALKVTTRPTVEAARLGKLRHPNVMPVHSVLDAAPLQAICMPYLGRLTLADWLDATRRAGAYPAARGAAATPDMFRAARTLIADLPTEFAPESPARAATPVPPGRLPRRVAAVLAGLARGLAHAHSRGILHLDLKPANVLLADDGGVLLLDFNLSHDRTAGDPHPGGTVPYMAPEQLDAHHAGTRGHVGEATDLFALGVVAYELLAGVHPYPTPRGRPDLGELAAARRVAASPLRARNPAVPPSLAALVHKLLRADPAERYPSAAALAYDLERHLGHYPLEFATNPSLAEGLANWGRRLARR